MMQTDIQFGLRPQKNPFPVDCRQQPGEVLHSRWGGAATDMPPVLLAFADDGLIWGQMRDQKLLIAHDANPAFGPLLRWESLQRLHLFGLDKELRIWKEKDGFSGVSFEEEGGGDGYYDEEQILLGTHLRGEGEMRLADGLVPFTPVEDLRGQWHAPPIHADEFRRWALRLQVRQYLSEDQETGMLKIKDHRIVRFFVKGA